MAGGAGINLEEYVSIISDWMDTGDAVLENLEAVIL